MLISKFGIKASFSHEIIGIIIQNYQQRKQMDSGTSFCTYIVYFLYGQMILGPPPSSLTPYSLQGCKTSLLSHNPALYSTFAAPHPLLCETLYSGRML